MVNPPVCMISYSSTELHHWWSVVFSVAQSASNARQDIGSNGDSLLSVSSRLCSDGPVKEVDKLDRLGSVPRVSGVEYLELRSDILDD